MLSWDEFEQEETAVAEKSQAASQPAPAQSAPEHAKRLKTLMWLPVLKT